jgi:hypothetical protein
LSATSYRGSVGNAFPAFQLTIEDPMAPQKPDSTTPVPVRTPVPASRSEALEAELAMLEAMLPSEAERSAQPTRVEPANDRGGAQ